MLSANHFKIPQRTLVELCQQWHISELALFGSALTEDFHEDSDIDLLISFAPDARQGLLTLAKIKHQFEEILHRKVDLVVKAAIEEGDNLIRRQEILNSAVTIYES
ncbi:nucleotidyltransferase family protein [Synechocystis salina]|uniref:Nucleotidyltransferase domain-containing protein n=1 Tax=Synechocystis salina LEGE 00031 TaxID=1828736 RepID=A0ABR9VUD2_9SYNC|nr:nucleotidyltransferase domain-containing protein [Synechocystis salina]MBE9241568.1 nucleotidyltransferase domain-containing protein [Synechocystis salina LEGE 00041]MBE9254942.1 nucleotidyltransferase domain-containing protein [Synechocystis salina LEGE 00031]